MPTRRRFLQATAALAASLPLARLGAGRPTPSCPSPPAHPMSAPTPSARPGLLFDAADLPRLRANLDHPRLAARRRELLGADLAADHHFLDRELRLHNRVADMARARQILERTSFAFALYRDPAQLALARAALHRLLAYPRWDYFLEGGRQTIGLQRAPEATIAICCALDWLGDALTADEITAAEHQLATKGAPACYLTLYGMKFPDRVRGWGFDPTENFPAQIDFTRWPLILNTNNLKVIPLCALAFAAVWLHGRHPEADQWLELARQSARAFAVHYGLDGSYEEGIGYWGYTTLHLVLFTEVLRRRLGLDESDLINYRGTARFALAMTMPTLGEPFNNPHEPKAYNFVPKGVIDPALDLVNFGDGGIGVDVSVAPWIGRHAQDPVAHYLAQHIGGLNHLPGIIWFDPHAPAAPPEPALLDVRLATDWVISRTGWTAHDTVVAFRSGGPSNHEHADRNSVIFKAHGERLFHDPFKAGYDPHGPRWLLRLPQAHTAVLIAGRGHQYHDGREGTNASWAQARIRRYTTGPGWMIAVSDATEAFELVHESVRLAERTLVFLKPDVLLILDRIRLDPAHPAPVQARFQINNEDGHARWSTAANAFAIGRPHAALHATVHAKGPAHLSAGQLDLPWDEGLYPFIEATSAPAAAHTLLTVAAARPAAEPDAPAHLAVDPTPTGWRVHGTHRQQRVDVTLDPTTLLPTVTIASL